MDNPTLSSALSGNLPGADLTPFSVARPQPGLRWLTGLSACFALSLMPILWNTPEVTLPSIAITATAMGLMALCVLVSGTVRHTGSGVRWCMILLALSYPVLCSVSYTWTGELAASRRVLLVEDAKLAFLALVQFFFGITMVRHAPTRALQAGFVITLVYVFSGAGSPSAQEIFERMQATGRDFYYQGLGDYFAVLALLVVIRARNEGAAILCVLLAAACLVLIPSRSSAILGVTALSIVLAVRFPVWTLALAALGMVLAFVLRGAITSHFEGTRLASLFDPAGDNSEFLRSEFLARGLEAILSNPLLGHYRFQVDAYGNAGYYVHNILDAWAQAGIVPFALLMGIVLAVLLRAMEVALQDRALGAGLLAVAAFAVGSWILTRTAFTPPLFLAAGVVLGHRLRSAAGPRTPGTSRATRKAIAAWRVQAFETGTDPT